MTELTNLQKRMVLIATILASGMAFLDGSVVNIALPTLQREMGARFIDIQWVINAYALTTASLLLIGGALGDKYGQRKIFSIGIVLFTIASVLAGLSETIQQLIVIRAIQGIGAAIMIPSSLAIINVSFEAKERGSVIGLWAGVSGGMAAFGSFLGGFLIETFNWPAVFYINVPLGLIALWATLQAVKDHEHERRKLDVFGTLFITLGLLGLSYGLMQGPVSGWNHWYTSGSIIAGLVAIGAFILVEKRAEQPMVPLEIFQNANVVGANITTFFLYGALAAVFFLLALNLQQVQELSPSVTALGLLPFPILILLFARKGGQLTDTIGPRLPMIAGPLIVALGMILLTIPSIGVPIWYFMPGVVVWALGMCVIIAPLTTTALSVPAHFSGAASGVNNAVSRTSGLLFIAIAGMAMAGLFSSRLEAKLDTLASEPTKTVIMQQQSRLAGIQLPDNLPESERAFASQAIKESYVYGYRVVVLASALAALLSAFVSFVTIRNSRPE